MRTVLSYHQAYIVDIGDDCSDYTPAWDAEAPVIARMLREHIAEGEVEPGRYLVGLSVNGTLWISAL